MTKVTPGSPVGHAGSMVRAALPSPDTVSRGNYLVDDPVALAQRGRKSRREREARQVTHPLERILALKVALLMWFMIAVVTVLVLGGIVLVVREILG